MTLKCYKTILLIIIIITNFKILASSELKVSKFSDIPNKINVNCQNALVIFDIDGVILFPQDGYLKPFNRKNRRAFLDKIEKEKRGE